jgi:hypothetical protein
MQEDGFLCDTGVITKKIGGMIIVMNNKYLVKEQVLRHMCFH